MIRDAMPEFPGPPAGKKGWPWQAPAPRAASQQDLSWPRISIVTPSFNQGRYIEETIRSVLLQGYPNLEYIVIDGGSTDETLDILRKYGPWLSHWTSEADSGQSDAIQKGFSRATGAWRNWLNSDDILMPGALDTVGRCARDARPQTRVLAFGCHICDDGLSRVLDSWRPAAPVAAFNFFGFGRTPVLPQPSTFVRADSCTVDRGLHFVMDWHLYLTIAARHRRAFESHDTVIASYRTHEATKTSTKPESFRDEAIAAVTTTPFGRVADRIAAGWWLQRTRGFQRLGARAGLGESLAVAREFPPLLFARQYWGHVRRQISVFR